MVAQDETLMCIAVCLEVSDHPIGRVGVAKGHQNLIENNLVQHVETGDLESVREAPGVTARALDKLGDPPS
jgi:hypothetical protein